VMAVSTGIKDLWECDGSLYGHTGFSNGDFSRVGTSLFGNG
jgi:hypothetical protein